MSKPKVFFLGMIVGLILGTVLGFQLLQFAYHLALFIIFCVGVAVIILVLMVFRKKMSKAS